MTTYWLFDLDFTLYSDYDINDTSTKDTYYNSIRKRPLLNSLIKDLDGEKAIFSNGNENHVLEVLKKMRLKKQFKKIAHLDNYTLHPKPSIKAYRFVIDKFKIKESDKIFFFEDSLNNLRVAKQKFNWTTILISKTKKKEYKYIDFIFPNIESAIFHFLKK